MNREMKFRAWSTKFNRFLSIGFNIIGETTLFDLLNQHRIEELDTIEIQQWTGFKDKNGKDIYEGDVVKYKMYDGSMDSKEDAWENTSTVKFENGAFFPRPEVYECEDSWYSYEYFDLEVVGNIFELKS